MILGFLCVLEPFLNPTVRNPDLRCLDEHILASFRSYLTEGVPRLLHTRRMTGKDRNVGPLAVNWSRLAGTPEDLDVKLSFATMMQGLPIWFLACSSQ